MASIINATLDLSMFRPVGKFSFSFSKKTYTTKTGASVLYIGECNIIVHPKLRKTTYVVLRLLQMFSSPTVSQGASMEVCMLIVLGSVSDPTHTNHLIHTRINHKPVISS